MPYSRTAQSDASVITEGNNNYFVNSGTPQYICLFDDHSSVDVVAEGKRISTEKSYLCESLAIIVSFVEVIEDGLHPRCYDPGCDIEALACGTASVAMAVACASKQGIQNGSSGCITVHWCAGDIIVSFNFKNGKFVNISQSG